MATVSAPILLNGKFAGRAATDIENRIKASTTTLTQTVDSSVAKAVSASEAKLTPLIQAKADSAYVDQKVKQEVSAAAIGSVDTTSFATKEELAAVDQKIQEAVREAVEAAPPRSDTEQPTTNVRDNSDGTISIFV